MMVKEEDGASIVERCTEEALNLQLDKVVSPSLYLRGAA